MPAQALNSIPQPQVQIINGESKRPNLKIILIIFLFIFLLLVVVFTLQSLRIITIPFLGKLSPTPPNTLVASISGENIYFNDLQEIAGQKYAKGAIDNKVLKLTLDNLIEGKILEQEAQKLNLQVPKSKDLLKSEIIKNSLDSREAYVVSVWVPSDEYLTTQAIPKTQAEETLKLREDIKKALEDVEERVNKNNQSLLEAAKFIYEKYPTLKSRLAFNGYILEKTKKQEALSTPKLYTYDDKKRGNAFFEFLFSLKEGAIKKFIEPDGSGGSVVQVTSVHTGANKDYADWLEEKIKEQVKFYSQL